MGSDRRKRFTRRKEPEALPSLWTGFASSVATSIKALAAAAAWLAIFSKPVRKTVSHTSQSPGTPNGALQIPSKPH
jgi:hypothetical protein